MRSIAALGAPRSGRSRHAVREIMQKLGYDPIEEMVAIAQDPGVALDVKTDLHKALAPYMYPRLNNLTLSGDEDGGPVRMEVDFVRRILDDPALVEAAQILGLAAADAALSATGQETEEE